MKVVHMIDDFNILCEDIEEASKLIANTEFLIHKVTG